MQVIGKDAFHDMSLCGRVTYVGDRWTQTGDVKVSELIGLEGRNKKDDGLLERRMHLLNVLDVDPHWRIYRLSDGQRRRVQILMAMIQPADVLLLDEISTDLDVIGRQNLLNFLKEEAVVRGATVVYSTHIFDGIESWASHIAWVTEKTVARYELIESLPELRDQRARNVVAPLFNVVEGWLRKEWEDKKAKDGPVTWAPQIDTYDLPDKQYLSDLSRTFNVPTPLPKLVQQRTAGL
jgi:CCR4-NOT complex subunit CAF16